MIQLASPSVSCRQSRPFGFRFWGGTSWLSTSRLEAAVCLVSVGCLLLRLSSGVGDGPRGGVCGFLAHWGFACLCRGKWRLKVRQATMLAGDDVVICNQEQEKMSSNFSTDGRKPGRVTGD